MIILYTNIVIWKNEPISKRDEHVILDILRQSYKAQWSYHSTVLTNFFLRMISLYILILVTNECEVD
jgi:uncharacterized membrane protein